MRHVIAIDQGTTGTTVLVLDQELRLCGRGYVELAQHYPEPGRVEHDPEQIWDSVTDALGQALAQAKLGPHEVAAIGVTNQRETAVLWDRGSGKPVHQAIVWQDRRTSDVCAQLKQAGHEARVRELAGLTIDPYFSATKVAWMFDHAGLRARAEKGELAFGTVDSFLLYRLTGGGVHMTDVSNASRTLMFELERLAWSDELLSLFNVPRSVLPAVAPSAGVFGTTRRVPGIANGVPVAGIAGDQQAALFGQACFAAGDAKCTYGTGAFILMNTGGAPVASRSGLLTTVAWQVPGELAYALEGSAFMAGAAVQWLRDGLGFFKSAVEIEALASSVEDSGGVVVVPALTGLGAPHWRPQARGVITGLTRGTTRAHIARATLEGIALQNVDILRAMERDSGTALRVLKVDGGAAATDLLMQFQSDVLGVEISRPEMLETTALGAAFLAGLGAGVWTSKDAITAIGREQRRFHPTTDRAAVAAHLTRWAE
jgi:glycerol kinase